MSDSARGKLFGELQPVAVGVEDVQKTHLPVLVDPSQYYFRTTPEFRVASKELDWLQRSVFVGRGIRKPDHVVVDYFIVE